jgi:RNA polymerase sigma-70 factor (ECF subfamily)
MGEPEPLIQADDDPAGAGREFPYGDPSPVQARETAPQAVSSGDFAEGDFAEVVRQQQAMVFSIALHFLRDRQAAEEIAQDVFLHLHQHLDSLKSPEHVTFWLRKVTSHRCIDFTRRRKWSQVSLDDVPELAATSTARDPLLQRKLRQLVASLPEMARAVVILRYQEDLTPTEIAEVLTMPVATVKSHLQRSLAMLREKVVRVIGDARV